VAAPLPVPVRMETAVVGGATLPLSAGALTLPAGTRDLDVRYAGLAFGRPEAVRYRVRLDGYDAAWRAPTHSTTATYTNLPPGRYTLRVEASLGGAWSAPATLDITRPPRFWETGLFVLLAVALMGLAGVALFRQRVRHLTKRQAVLENTVEARTVQLRANEVRLAEQAAALRRADAVKTRFLANLTHEFRTPLTLTFGPLDDLLADRYATVDEARPVLRRARRQGERLLRLINQLLDLARMDAEGIRLRPEHGDLAAFLRHRVALFGSRLEERGLAVHLDLPEAPILHAFDPRLLETAVLNLLANAVKFTEPGGTITVGARTDALGTATVWIRDTGVGIAPEHLPHVFDRFYQADGSNTRQHEGSGIGLALVQEVAALHGGTVSAESELGVGTTFTLRLPRLTGVAQPDAGGAAPPLQVSESTPPPGAETRALAPEDRAGHEATTGANGTAQAPREAVPGADAPESERPVVLVVEDSPDLRAYLRSHLDATYDVIEATDGAEGVRLALEHVPDLVLSDVMMPLLDGFAVLATLKTDPRTSHVPIVLLTARADAESRQLGLGEGADDYLAKPFDMGEVLARIANLIAQRRQLRALWDPRRSAPDVAGDGTEQPADVAEPNGPGAETVTSTVTSTVTPTVVARETAFLARVEAIVAARMTEVAFGADALAVALHMSARQLRRKLQSVCGTSPAAFIQQVRLRAAVALVEQGELTMGEVAAAVGFASASTFRKAFGRVYGCTPTAYVNARLQEQDGKAEPSA
ncbi:MAG: ATP-binding protein, partial [Bacteroidota bacterium]